MDRDHICRNPPEMLQYEAVSSNHRGARIARNQMEKDISTAKRYAVKQSQSSPRCRTHRPATALPVPFGGTSNSASLGPAVVVPKVILLDESSTTEMLPPPMERVAQRCIAPPEPMAETDAWYLLRFRARPVCQGKMTNSDLLPPLIP